MKKLLSSVILTSSLLCGCATWDKIVLAIGKIDVPVDDPDISTTTTTTTIPPVNNADELPWDSIHWIGQANGSKAAITKTLRSVTIKGNNVYIDWDGNDDWNPVHHSDWQAGVDCYGRMCCFVIRDGKLIGGHVDHMKKGCKHRDLNNVYGQYIFNPPVSPSEDIYFAFVSNDCKNRTKLVKGIKK